MNNDRIIKNYIRKYNKGLLDIEELAIALLIELNIETTDTNIDNVCSYIEDLEDEYGEIALDIIHTDDIIDGIINTIS